MAGNSAALNFILSLTDKVTGPMGKVNSSFSELGTVGQTGIKQMGMGLAGLVGTGYALQAAMGPAIDQQRALGEVKSLGVSADGLDLLNQKSMQFAITYGESAQAFVRSAYDIQSAIGGLTSEQLAVFTNASNVLAKATKADAATVTSYVGTMYGIFKGQADAMGKGEWVENLTGMTATAVQMFKTTGQGMADAFTGVGANATAAGIDMAEQMAILGTLQATMSGGEAGTKYKAFLSGVGGAQDKLGLSFTDSEGAMLPMLEILDKLKGKFGDTLDVSESDALKKAFGSDEAVSLIKLLMADTDGLAASMDQLGQVKGMEQAETMAQAMVDPWAQFASMIEVVRIAFGQLIGPALVPLLQYLTEGGAQLTKWTTQFPHLAKAVGMATLGLVGMVAAISLFTFAMGMCRSVMAAFLIIQKTFQIAMLLGKSAVVANVLWGALYVTGLILLGAIMGTVSLVMLAFQAVMWLVNAAMVASPITWIVLGIVALVAIVIAAIYFWDEWTSALLNSEAFARISEQFQMVCDWFTNFGTLATQAWDDFTTSWSNLSVFDLLGDAANGFIELLNKIPGINIETRFGGTPPGGPEALAAGEQASVGSKAQQSLNDAMPSMSPSGPDAVPPGGLMQSFQNTSNQNKGTRIERMEIHTGEPMSQHELENMIAMTAG
jgi:TP901 family phage tail tape measure protein